MRLVDIGTHPGLVLDTLDARCDHDTDTALTGPAARACAFAPHQVGFRLSAVTRPVSPCR